MSKHTPEPWKSKGFNIGMGYDLSVEIVGPKGRLVARFVSPTPPPPNFKSEPFEDNIRRLLACVNACRGVPTEALEAFAKHGILGSYWADEWEQAFNEGSDLSTW